MSVEKVGKKYENVGKSGKSHGTFATKEGAEKQKAAMFENGYHVSGSRIQHEDFKAKLRKAVSDAYDAHVKEHGGETDPEEGKE